MTVQTYTTRAGDTVDGIAYKVYGSSVAAVTESILEANRGLADYGPSLPAGVAVTIPELVSPAKKSGVKLWD